jgi:hypothetical protein
MVAVPKTGEQAFPPRRLGLVVQANLLKAFLGCCWRAVPAKLLKRRTWWRARPPHVQGTPGIKGLSRIKGLAAPAVKVVWDRGAGGYILSQHERLEHNDKCAKGAPYKRSPV